MMTILSILIFLGVIVVIKIMEGMMDNRKCPDDALLKDVILRKVDRDSKRARTTIRHLGICEKCRDRVHDFSRTK